MSGATGRCRPSLCQKPASENADARLTQKVHHKFESRCSVVGTGEPRLTTLEDDLLPQGKTLQPVVTEMDPGLDPQPKTKPMPRHCTGVLGNALGSEQLPSNSQFGNSGKESTLSVAKGL